MIFLSSFFLLIFMMLHLSGSVVNEAALATFSDALTIHGRKRGVNAYWPSLLFLTLYTEETDLITIMRVLETKTTTS